MTYMKDDNDRFEAAMRRGVALFWDREYEAALRLYTALIADNPNNAELFFRRGGVYFQMQRYDESIADRDRAEALGRRSSRLYFVRALAKMAAGYYRLAIEDLDKAEAHDHDRYFGDYLRLERAECYLKLDQPGMAMAECLQVPDSYMRPNYPGAVGAKQELMARIKAYRN